MSTTLEPAGVRPGIIRRARSTIRTHPVVTAASALVIGALVVWLVFFVFAFHLLFIDDKVDEADPFAAGSPSATSLGASPGTASADAAGKRIAAHSSIAVTLRQVRRPSRPMEQGHFYASKNCVPTTGPICSCI